MSREFFSAIVGTRQSATLWRACVKSHVVWLGAVPEFVALPTPDGRVCILCVAHIRGETVPLTLSEGKSLSLEGVTVAWSLDGETLTFIAALAHPVLVCFTSLRDGTLVVGDDLRFVASFTDATVDDDALRSLLCYGCVPPGRALIRGVSSLAPGYALDCSIACGAWTLRTATTLGGSSDLRTDVNDEQRMVTLVNRCLPDNLKGPVVLLSGGVDSALLLAVLQRRGSNIRCAHFEMTDEETSAARGVARHLGASVTVIPYRVEQVDAVLADLFRDYRYPSGDFSATVTNALVREINTAVPDAYELIDGTGADGLFAVGGMAQRWRVMSYVPQVVLDVMGAPLWWSSQHWRNDQLGRAMVVARRLASEPLEVAGALSRHALAGIAFDLPAFQHQEIVGTFLSHLTSIMPDAELSDRITMLDVFHSCARQMAAKDSAPARARGLRVVYPFLSDTMIRESQQWSWKRKCAGGVSKALLKDTLATMIPRSMVDRKKTGFTPDIGAIFARPAAQERCRALLLQSGGPLDGVVHRNFVRNALDRVRNGPVNGYVMNFLWTALFAATWLDGLRARRFVNEQARV
jgi:asparagine synthetase B (glutamine-hydrolysing)